jgi:hypothetical protein
MSDEDPSAVGVDAPVPPQDVVGDPVVREHERSTGRTIGHRGVEDATTSNGAGKSSCVHCVATDFRTP